MLSQITAELENETITNRIEFLVNDENRNLEDYSEIYDELEYYLNNPLNINLQPEILKDLGLIDNLQLKSIVSYVENNGNITLLHELQAIKNMDKPTIIRIAPFIDFSGIKRFRPTSYSSPKSSLILRNQAFLEKQKGFKDDKSFIGSQSKTYARLRLSLDQKLTIGLAMENDIGEPIQIKRNYYVLDHYSFFLKRRVSNNNSLIIGDYLVNFGQGLVSWTGAGRAKSSDVMQIKKVGRKIRESASSNEVNYLRGMAFNSKSNRLDYAIYYSLKSIDARLSEDKNTIESFPKSGYHRTESEIATRKKGLQENFGASISFSFKRVEIGAAFSTERKRKKKRDKPLEIPLFNDLQLPNHFSSLYFDLNKGLFNFFGEAAKDKKNNNYFTSGLLLALHKDLSIAFHGRYSQSSIDNEQSTTFSESGKSGNERGIYTGMEWRVNKRLKLSLYQDLFEFPESKYLVTGPSKGNETLMQIESEFTNSLVLLIRFRTELKEKNVKSDFSETESIGNVIKNGFRVELRNEVSDQLQLKSRIESTIYNVSNSPSEKGILLFQDFKWRSKKNKSGVDFRFALFKTPSFNSRIYAYENDVLFAFSIPSFSGNGIRSYIMFQQKLLRKLKVWIRYARTTYYDRDKISSGLTEIEGNVKSELKAQLKFSF